MALTDEQRTLLQLLLEGGQSYEDIGSLLGVSTDEVRSRARSALQEIGGADPDGQVGLSDYLLGQADPIGRADAVRHLQGDPEANALAQRLVQNLRLLAPNGQLPEIPESRGGRRAPAPPPPPSTPAPPPPAAPPAPGAPPPAQGPGFASRVAGVFSGLGALTGKRRTQFVVGLAAALTLVIVVLVVATSGGSEDGKVVTLASGEEKTVPSDCEVVNPSSSQQAGIRTIRLGAAGAAAQAECPPSGQIILGSLPQSQQTKNQTPTVAIQVNAVQVPSVANTDGYLLWLYKSESQAVPVGPVTVDANGNLTGTIPMPLQELLLFSAFDSMRVTKVTAAQAQQLQQSVRQQGKKPSLLVPIVGDTVLQGNVSDLRLDELLQQAQSQAQANQGAGKKG